MSSRCLIDHDLVLEPCNSADHTEQHPANWRTGVDCRIEDHQTGTLGCDLNWAVERSHMPFPHKMRRSGQPNSDMDDLALAPRGGLETTRLEQLQHGGVFGQYLCGQGSETGCIGNTREMTHQCPADATPLIFVDHGKGDLGLPGLHDNVTSAARYYRAPPFIYQRNQRHVLDEIDVHEERGFFICEAALKTEEPAIKGPGACATDSGEQIGPVVGSESSDFNPASIAERLSR